MTDCHCGLAVHRTCLVHISEPSSGVSLLVCALVYIQASEVRLRLSDGITLAGDVYYVQGMGDGTLSSSATPHWPALRY